MTKQEQDQKKLVQQQQLHAKQQFQQREQILLNKEFAVREWKAEVEMMYYAMEYDRISPEFKKFQEERAQKEPIQNEESKSLVVEPTDQPQPITDADSQG